jgi:hypothetical protein
VAVEGLSVRAFAAALAFCLPLAATCAAQQPEVLSCIGPFARTANEAALVKAFGQQNVARAEIDVGEGMTEAGTIVYPRDPKRRLQVLWHDSKTRSRPASISIPLGAIWRIDVAGAKPPIRQGMTLAEVEAANGRPFEILGFGWDRGGHAGDWKGGRLAKPDGGCELSLRFDPEPGFLAMEAISGDRPFTSADARMRAVKPVVVEVRLNWP